MASKKFVQKSMLTFIKNEKENSENTSDFVKKTIESRIQSVAELCQKNENIDENQNKNRISELEAQLEIEKKKTEKLTNDLKKSVASIKNAGEINLKKDFQIDLLMTKLKATCIDEKNNTQADPANQSLFAEFSNIFAEKDLIILRSISSGKSRDSTFVLKCVEFLYRDHSVLQNMTVTGKCRNKKKQTNDV